jgi:hypothetical protein
MVCIALVRCVLVLRCGLAGVVWCGIRMQAEALYPDTTPPQPNHNVREIVQSHNFPHPGRIVCYSARNSRPPATKALHTICGNNTSIVSNSWWWAYNCSKHVEQIISPIKHSVTSSYNFLCLSEKRKRVFDAFKMLSYSFVTHTILDASVISTQSCYFRNKKHPKFYTAYKH